MASSPAGQRYETLANGIDSALRFMNACGLDTDDSAMRQVELYTSHEALLLGYEEALTRTDSITGDWYGLLRAHALGGRTHQRARRCPRGVPARRAQPDRGEARTDGDTRRGARTVRDLESEPDTRPPDADQPHGGRQHP